MAELAAASAVAGIISLTIQVIQVSHRYFTSIRHSSRTIKAYFRELDLLKLSFSEIEKLIQNGSFEVDVTALRACYDELDTVRCKLAKRKGIESSATVAGLTRLTWPFADDEMRRLIEVLHRYQESFQTLLIANNTSTLNSTLKTLQENERRHKVELKNNIIRWLSPTEILDNHTAARNKHEYSTCQWIFSSKAYQYWKESEKGELLWLTGYPGQGKTILCSSIVDNLLKFQSADDFVTYFYFDFRDERKQTVESALRSIIAQICVRADEVPSEIENLYHRFRSTNSIPRHLLEEVLGSFSDRIEKLIIVLDALDESSERLPLLKLLQSSFGSDGTRVKCLVTSRHEQDIKHGLSQVASGFISLDKDIIDRDIRIHVRACLQRDSKLCSRPDEIKDLIEDALVRKAGGMFRWVECQLEALRRCRNAPQIQAALDDLPADIDTTYARILWSIDQESREFARRALEMLLFTKRPLKLSELAESVVIEYSCRPFDPGDRLFEPTDIVGICRGLVSWDPDTQLVSLSHYSVREYLLSDRFLDSGPSHFVFKHFDSDCNIAMICLNYLMSIGETIVGFRDIRICYPFLEYATVYWLLHAASSIGDLSGSITRNAMLFLAASDHASSFWINLLKNDWESLQGNMGQNFLFDISHVLDHLSTEALLKLLQYGQEYLGEKDGDVWNAMLEILSDRAEMIHQDIQVLSTTFQVVTSWKPHLLCEPFLMNSIMFSAIEASNVEAVRLLNQLYRQPSPVLARRPCFDMNQGIRIQQSTQQNKSELWEEDITRLEAKSWHELGRLMRQTMRSLPLSEMHTNCSTDVVQPRYVQQILEDFPLESSNSSQDSTYTHPEIVIGWYIPPEQVLEGKPG